MPSPNSLRDFKAIQMGKTTVVLTFQFCLISICLMSYLLLKNVLTL